MGNLYELLTLVRLKFDENNNLRQAIHLFSNQPIDYLLFEYIGIREKSNVLAITHGGMNEDNFEPKI